jgi:hypothetical protein
MPVKFIKTLRNCPFNQVAGPGQRKIYDYAIEDNGETVAWFKWHYGVAGWSLCDSTGRPVRRQISNRLIRTVAAANIASFEETYAAHAALLPTAEQIAERDAAIAAKAAEEAATSAEQSRRYRIAQAGEALYEAAKAVLNNEAGGIEALRAAVAQAEYEGEDDANT